MLSIPVFSWLVAAWQHDSEQTVSADIRQALVSINSSLVRLLDEQVSTFKK